MTDRDFGSGALKIKKSGLWDRSTGLEEKARNNSFTRKTRLLRIQFLIVRTRKKIEKEIFAMHKK
jgi:hypothetical protein